MQPIAALLAPERIAWNVPAGSKKRALEILSELLAKGVAEHDAGAIFASLVQREKLGSTGVGQGIALPHGRLAGLEAPVGAVLRLAEPIDYDSSDGRPADIFFALLVPEQCAEDHLQIMRRLAELFRDGRTGEALRGLDSAPAALAYFSETDLPRRASA